MLWRWRGVERSVCREPSLFQGRERILGFKRVRPQGSVAPQPGPASSQGTFQTLQMGRTSSRELDTGTRSQAGYGEATGGASIGVPACGANQQHCWSQKQAAHKNLG